MKRKLLGALLLVTLGGALAIPSSARVSAAGTTTISLASLAPAGSSWDKVFRAWVSEFQSLPDLDANANAVAIQHLKLENEGWERDVEVVEPLEPTFVVP